MTYVKIDNGSDKRLYIENCTDVLWASTCDFCTYRRCAKASKAPILAYPEELVV